MNSLKHKIPTSRSNHFFSFWKSGLKVFIALTVCLLVSFQTFANSNNNFDLEVVCNPHEATCGENNGAVTTTVSGGVAPYNYFWSNGSTSTAIVNLAPGSYSVTVVDALGNTASCTNTVIGNPGITITSVIVVEAHCGEADGYATVNVVGDPDGTVYDYNWSSNTGGSNNNQAFNLLADTFSVTITDPMNSECFLVETFTVGNVDGPDSPVVTTASICGEANGSATFENTNYGYTWDPDLGTPNGNIRTDLPAGIYFVTITDLSNPDCDNVKTVVIEEIPSITVDYTVNNPPDCGAANGSVTINANGGSGNYNYSWGAATVDDLAAGTYEVTVTDTDTGCTGSVIFTLLDSGGGATVTIDDVVIACAGDMDGTVVYTVTYDPGFIFPADTIIQDANGNEYINGTLSPGTYCIVIKDANGCYIGSDCFEIEAPTQIDADLAIVNETCDSLGSITIDITGGAGGYTYLWDPAQDPSGPVASDLSSGLYNVTISDANGCSGSVDDLLVDFDCPPPPPPCFLTIESVIVIEASCGNNDGFATVNVVGDPNGDLYDYTWSSNVDSLLNNQVYELFAGTYSVTIVDPSDSTLLCSFVETFTVGNIDGPESDYAVTHTSCHLDDGTVTFTEQSFEYAWNPSLGTPVNNYERADLPGGEYFITITDPANPGCEDVITVVVDEDSPLEVTATVNANPDCGTIPPDGSVTINVVGGSGDYTYSWGAQTIDTLSAGIYEVFVIDNVTECEGIITFSLSSNDPQADLVINSSDSLLCPGHETSFVDFTVNYDAGFAFPADTIITDIYGAEYENGNIPAGSYCILIIDANGCQQAGDCFEVESPSQIDVDVSIYPADCDSLGLISLAVTGGAGGYTYNWDPPILSGSTVEDLDPGTYSVTVSDVKGCSVGAGQLIVEDDCPQPPPCFITSVVVIEASCRDSNGFAIVNVAGDPNGDLYDYEWSSNVGGSINNQAFGLSADTYSVTITDNLNTGCFLIETFTVGNIDGPESGYIVTPSSCTVNNGMVTFDSTNYEYSWFPDIGIDQGYIRDSLPAGAYFVTITDPMDTSCIDVITVVVEGEGSLNVSPFSINSTDCDSNDGSAEINTLALGGSGDYAIIWESLGLEIGTGTIINALSVGNYTITVTDNITGCVGTSTFSILGGDPPLGDTITIDSISSLLCAGDENGMVFFTAPSSLDSVEIVDQYGNVYQNGTLGHGSYCINGYDSTGCLIDAECFEIEGPDQIDVDISIYPVECDSFGFISLAITGGTPPYEVLLDGQPIPPGLTIEDLESGTYILTVSDANDCNVGAVALFVGDDCPVPEPPCELIIDGKFSKNASCGLADGWAKIIMDNTSGTDYTYTWSSNIPNSNSIDSFAYDLAAGTYFVTVTNVSHPDSCFIVETFIIENPLGPDSDYVVEPSVCGEDNGTITFDVPIYNYQWDPVVSTSHEAINLPVGIYFVTISDTTNCVSIKAIEVEEIPSITIESIDVVPPDCNVENGEVTVTASGGLGGYSYTLFPNFGTQNGNSWTDLPSGIYSITVTDTTTGCFSDTIFALSPATLNIEIDSISTLLCPGDENGTVYYTVNSTGPTTEEIVDLFGNVYQNGSLGPGFYCIIASDTTGCEAIECFEIEAPTQINAVVEITDVTCDSLGSISLDLEGGAGGYSISWTPNVGTLSGSYLISDLPADIYSVTVTDANGCSISGDIPIQEDSDCCEDPIIDGLLIVNTTCGNSNGFAYIAVDEGPNGFIYTWSPNVSFPNDSIAEGLSAGVYSVTVADALYPDICFIVETFVVENIDGPMVTYESTPTGCGQANGTVTFSNPNYIYEWEPALGTQISTSEWIDLPAGEYSITITDPLVPDCPNYIIVNVEELPSVIITSLTLVPPDCGLENGEVTVMASGGSGNYSYTLNPNVGTQNGNSWTDLPAGVYSVTVIDTTNGCFTDTIFVLSPVTIDIEIDSISTLLCPGDEDGTVYYTVNSTEPTTEEIVDIFGNVYQNGSLGPGFYCIIATDTTGCEAIECFEIEAPSQINVVVEIENEHCDSLGSITLVDVNGGAGGYIYDWEHDDTLVDSLATDLEPGDYGVTITDTNGCSISGVIPIQVDSNKIIIDLMPDTLVCDTTPILITYNITPDSAIVVWTDQDGNLFDPDIPVTPNDTSVYYVEVTSGDCFAMDSVTIILVDSIVVDTFINTMQCDSTTIDFSVNESPFVIYVWNFGDPGNPGGAIGPNPSHTYSDTGCFTVTLIMLPNSSATCFAQDTILHEVCVVAPPLFDLAIDVDTDCNDNAAEVTLEDISTSVLGDIIGWEWTINGDSVSIDSIVIIDVFETDTLDIELIVLNEEGCLDTLTQEVLINIIDIEFPDSILACEDDLIQFYNGLDSTLVFEWAPPDIFDDPNHPYAVAHITEDVTITVSISDTTNLHSCPQNDTIEVLVDDPINLIIIGPQGDSIYCDAEDLPSSLTADCDNCDVNLIEWLNENDSIIGMGSQYPENPDNPLMAGTYYAQFIDTISGCSDIDSITLELAPDFPLVVPDTTICLGDIAHLYIEDTLGLGNATYFWEGSNIISSDTLFEIFAMPTQTETYTLIVTFENGCTGTYLPVVDVINIGEITATADTSQICIYETVQLDVTQIPNGTYNWSNGETLDNPSIHNPVGTPLETTTYEVVVMDEISGCAAISEVTITVVHPACEEPYVFFPNAFTPNGDGHNDELCLRGTDVTDVHFIIYNRWGEKMFESNSQGECWDGTFAGKELGSDVYGYYLQVRCGNGEEFIKKGNVTILK